MNRQIKVLYLISNADPYGSNIALLNLLDQLLQKGVIPIVVMWKYGKICKILEKKGIKYYIVKYRYSVYPKFKTLKDIILFLPLLFRTLWLNFLAHSKLKRIAIHNHIDIIHTNISILHIGHTMAQKLNKPHIWHIREYQDLYIGYRPIFTWKGYFKKLSANNCYPVAISNGLFEHYNLKDNAKVIYDGVMKASQTKFLSDKEKYFLFVGRLEEAKGVMNIINSFIETIKCNDNYNLVIVGSGNTQYTNKLIDVASKSQLREKIKFLGFRNDVYDLMAKATALLVPSSFEGFGFTTVEAMFNGCLVIGFNSGGTKEILVKEQLGILYSTHAELNAILEGIISNGIENYYPTIYKAQKVASELYSIERNATEINNLYNAVIEKI